MVKQILFLVGASTLIWSCSKDEIIDTEAYIPEPEIIEESTSESPKEEVASNEEIATTLNKTINWVSNAQMANGLLESAENTNFVSLYDNALATLIFVQQGKLGKAEQILDFFKGRIQSELKANSGGFYQFRDANGENGSRTWMGDNAWLLIAINHYHKASGNQKYDYLAEEIENWLRSLQDTDGGLKGGWNEDGSEIPKVSEGIITAFNAVSGYDDFHKNVLTYLKDQRWIADESTIVAWPENPAYNYALDLHALSYGSFVGFPEKVLTQTERYTTTQTATVSGKQVHGYCFDEDKDVIWLEGTAQMAVAYQTSGNSTKANQLMLEIEKTIIASTTLENAVGIPYTTNFGTNFGSNDLWDHVDLTPAISSTAWYFFAKTGFNPLALGKQKNVPAADQFWIEIQN